MNLTNEIKLRPHTEKISSKTIDEIQVSCEQAKKI